jgi:hypothetical protein
MERLNADMTGGTFKRNEMKLVGEFQLNSIGLSPNP